MTGHQQYFLPTNYWRTMILGILIKMFSWGLAYIPLLFYYTQLHKVIIVCFNEIC